MTTMTRFVPFRATLRNPFQDVAVLQNRLNSIFEDFARTDAAEAQAQTQAESLAAGGFIPPVDIFEDAQQVMLKLEVPGIRQQDLDIRVENQLLTVKGERKFESDHKEENYHRIERRFGTFVRTFTLPPTVDTDAVSASYDAGVLTISIAKKPEAKPKQVKIDISAGKGTQTPKQVEGSAA
jgi:HSP20 family protein